MVDDHSTNELIRWSDDGLSFLVIRHEEFAKKVLPRFFKHSNFSSFVRQLNMYGFHKVPHLQNGVLGTEGETERWEFSNPHFQRNQPDLLLLVTRKKGRDPEEREGGAVDMHHILDEIAAIKRHQMSISKELKVVQTDNQVLWRESMASRERHHRHQETINKILRFLASVFSSDKNKHAIPRKRQYLLGDGTQHHEQTNTPSIGKKREHIKIEDVDDEDEDDEQQPTKQKKISAPFDISDYVHEANALAKDMSLAPLPSPIPSLTPATADLQAAIALNDQTKKDTVAFDSPDLSALLNLPQFQGLINLAQTNPGLFNQLTNTQYFDVPPPPPSQDTFTDISTPSLSQVGTPMSSQPVETPTNVHDLESSLKSLATELGFENDKLDYVNMDDFLTNYTSPSSSTKSDHE
ncbi:stress-responsive transcription factor hsf1 [Rhizopus stolonifer]|uniref:Stress-responsive transcription factor hsf1 n=2 Tax=Mucorineae TaxID=1344963 RepID=A0A367JNH6_RHIST|nr:stress-responsive transcription factor hsf1 [Rhizopus stolonifer]